MEEKIFFIGLRKIHSTKKDTDYYMVDYVDKDNVPQTDYITLEEFNLIASKSKDKIKKDTIGIFGVNSFKKVYLKDIKA